MIAKVSGLKTGTELVLLPVITVIVGKGGRIQDARNPQLSGLRG